MERVITDIPVGKNKRWMPVVFLIVIILLLSLYMIYWGAEKEGFYIDEMFSMMNIRGGGLDRPYYYDELFNTWYTAQELESTIGVTSENAFSGIFSAQNLYWSLLHIAYSFTPDEFSAWPSVILNIIIFAGCVAVIYLLSQMFIENKYLALLPGLLWGLSSAAVNLVMYIRFYCLKTLICLLLAYVVLQAVKNGFNKWIYPVAIALLMCTGAFIHQYFLVFAFFLTAIVCFYLLFTKNFKPLFIFAGLMAAGAAVFEIATGQITGVLSFEGNVTSGSRADEAMDFLLSGNEGYGNRISLYLSIISRAVFAGISPAIVVVVFVLLAGISYIAYTRNEKLRGGTLGVKQFFADKKVHFWLILCGVCLCYVLMIARITIFQDYRYVFCITPFVFILFVSLLVNVPTVLGFKRPLIAFIILALPCSFLLVRNVENIYIYRERGAEAVLSRYHHLPVICVNGGGEQISRCYWLLFDFDNKVMLTADEVDIDVAKELSFEEGLIYMYPTVRGEQEVESFSDVMGFTSRTHLLTLVRHSVYLLE